MAFNKYRYYDPGHPDGSIIEAAAFHIKNGGVVVFPTSGLYGLGADAFNPESIQKLFEIKGRSLSNPILLLIREQEQLAKLVREIPVVASRIIDKFWPGKVTIVFNALPHLSKLLTGGSGKIGVRMCGHPAAKRLIEAVGGPITGTSANISGKPGCSQIEDLDPVIHDRVDFIVDTGPLSGGAGSTVIDISVSPPRIIREGAVSAAEIFEIIGKSLAQNY